MYLWFVTMNLKFVVHIFKSFLIVMQTIFYLKQNGYDRFFKDFKMILVYIKIIYRIFIWDKIGNVYRIIWLINNNIFSICISCILNYPTKPL